MPATITCSSCQSRFAMKSELAGRRLKCGKCGQMLDVPAETPAAAPGTVASPVGVACASCGAKYTLKPEHIGKRLKCGKCGQMMTFTAGKPAASAGSSAKAAPAAAKSAPSVVPKPHINTASSLLDGLSSLPSGDLMSDFKSSATATPTKTPQVAPLPSDDFWADIPPAGAPAAASKTPDAEQTPLLPAAPVKKKKASGMPVGVQAGIFLAAGFIATPVLFLVLQLFLNSLLALLVSALVLNFVAGVCSFAVSCIVFGKKSPGFDEIIRIVSFGTSTPALIIIGLILFGGGTSGLFIKAAVILVGGVLFMAQRCIKHLNMEVGPAALVAFFGMLGGIGLTTVGYFMLGAIFLKGGGLEDTMKSIAENIKIEKPSEEQMKARAAEEDAEVEKMLSESKRVFEARAWLSGTSSGKEYISWKGERTAMVQFIEDLYAAGAKEIKAVFTDPEKPGLLTAYVVALPDDAEARKKILDVHQQFWKKSYGLAKSEESEESDGEAESPFSFVPEDYGQKYMLESFEF
jgi:predicted Zn finger-like uncharacterized protein